MIDYQDIKFWEGRILPDANPQDGPGKPDLGFDVIDPIHQEIINKLIKPNDKVLDAGCGVGRISGWFDNYTGIDFVPEFIYQAHRQHPYKKFVCANFNKVLPFKDKEFDWVIMISASQYCKTDEIKRVGKKVLILSYGEPRTYEVLCQKFLKETKNTI